MSLALLGGPKIRTKVFSSRPHIDQNERAAVDACLQDSLFSRFIGSPTGTVRDDLRLTSEDAEKNKEFWSFLGGPNVRKFEALWAQAHKTRYAISVNSATSGLTAALLALGLEPGDEVITTPFSFTATATSIVAAQGVPVFADVDLDTFCLSAETAEKAVSSKTRCVMPVHLLGNAGDIEALVSLTQKKNLKLLEDSAQAPGGFYKGKHLGTIGDAGVFSFQETKNVMTGEGGMIVTSDPLIAEKCRLIRNHGESIPMHSDSDAFALNIVGFNFRMQEPIAALGWVQTQKLAMLNGIRRQNYLYLLRRLKEVAGEFLTPQKLTNPDTYVPYCAGFRWNPQASGLRRDLVAQALRAEGIPVVGGFPRLMSENVLFTRQMGFGSHQWPFREAKKKPSEDGRTPYPNATRLQYEEYLGFFQMGWPNTEEDMEDIARAFEKILAHKKELLNHQPEGSTGGGFVSGRL